MNGGRVLVTGGAGFIGSHVVEALAGRGYDPAVLDDLSSGSKGNLALAGTERLYEIDVCSAILSDVFRSERPDAVIHLAAQVDVRASAQDPRRDAEINVLGTLNVLDQARAHGVRSVVIASSGGAAFGEPRSLPVRETARGRPISPYGIAKRALHDYARFYEKTHGMRVAVLAPSNVYGPRQDPFGEAGVVAIFLGAMLAGRRPLVFGDGRQTRDFVFVGDVADGFVRALGAEASGVLNVGTGVETSVLDLWRLCAEEVGWQGRPDFAPARTEELARSSLDATRAERALGWHPTVALREGLRRTADHIRATMHMGSARATAAGG